MSISAITVEATLASDGMSLQLERKVTLPPGRVTVTVHAATAKSGPTMLAVLDQIHRAQQQRGRRPMTEAEMAAEIARMRAEDDEYEARWRSISSHTGEKMDPF